MKLKDLKESTFDPQSSLDHHSSEMTFPNVYQKHDYGKDSKPKREKVVIKDTKTGRVIGVKMIYQRDIS